MQGSAFYILSTNTFIPATFPRLNCISAWWIVARVLILADYEAVVMLSNILSAPLGSPIRARVSAFSIKVFLIVYSTGFPLHRTSSFLSINSRLSSWYPFIWRTDSCPLTFAVRSSIKSTFLINFHYYFEGGCLSSNLLFRVGPNVPYTISATLWFFTESTLKIFKRFTKTWLLWNTNPWSWPSGCYRRSISTSMKTKFFCSFFSSLLFRIASFSFTNPLAKVGNIR